MPAFDDGIDEMVIEMRAEGAPYERALEIRNVAEHAEHVEDMEGYFVIDEDHMAETVERHAQALADADLPLSRVNLDRTLAAAGFEEVDYLRSLTGQTTDDGRTRHPGYWADDTTQLANSYEPEVVD